jgi:hypothetical protein
VAKGALGISSVTCAESGKERRTATRAPPAETFRAVANSRNSFPFSSRLRTNTGIANGRRVHLRRSVSGFRRFNPAPSGTNLRPEVPHLGGQTAHASGKTSYEKPVNSGRFRENYRNTAAIVYGYFRFFYAPARDFLSLLNGLQLQAFSSP